jgi:hypothetical protein
MALTIQFDDQAIRRFPEKPSHLVIAGTNRPVGGATQPVGIEPADDEAAAADERKAIAAPSGDSRGFSIAGSLP